MLRKESLMPHKFSYSESVSLFASGRLKFSPSRLPSKAKYILQIDKKTSVIYLTSCRYYIWRQLLSRLPGEHNEIDIRYKSILFRPSEKRTKCSFLASRISVYVTRKKVSMNINRKCSRLTEATNVHSTKFHADGVSTVMFTGIPRGNNKIPALTLFLPFFPSCRKHGR